MKQSQTEGKIKKFNVGGMWEFPFWEIHFNKECSSYGDGKPCKHCSKPYHKDKFRTDGTVYNEDEKNWICPRVVVASNEGGFNSTGICADCILENLTNYEK